MSSPLFLLVVLLCCTVKATAILVQYGPMPNRQLMIVNNTRKSEITDYLGNYLCNLRTRIIYVYREHLLETDLVEDILTRLNRCLVAPIEILELNDQQPKLNDDGVQMYLVLVLNEPDRNYERELSFLQKKSAAKHRSRFFVVIEKPVDPGEWIKDIFREFWKHHILNVIVIFWNGEENVYTFNPFFDDYRLQLPSNLAHANDLFYDKLSNQNQRELRVSIFNEEMRAIYTAMEGLSGPDGFFARTLEKKMNATFKFIEPADNLTYGQYNSNGSATGALLDVMTEHVNFSINLRYYIIQEFWKRVEMSHTNGKDDICFLVPKLGDGSHLANLFKSFEKPVWMAVVSSFFAMAITWTCILNLERTSPDTQQIFMDLYRSYFGQPIMRAPQQTSAKFMLTFWMLYSLLITSSFKGTLTSSLALPPSRNDINTIQELVASELPILAFSKFYKYMTLHLDDNRSDHQQLMANIKEVSDDEYFYGIQSNNNSVGYANKMHLIKYWAMKKIHMTKEGRPVYHFMAECPVPYLTTYIFPYGSPLVGKVNSILRSIQEAGIWPFWEKVTDELQLIAGRKIRYRKHSPEEFQQLQIYHLEGAFYILMLGLLISSLVFFGELVIHKRKRMHLQRHAQRETLEFPFLN